MIKFLRVSLANVVSKLGTNCMKFCVTGCRLQNFIKLKIDNVEQSFRVSMKPEGR